MGSATPRTAPAVGRAMFREIARAKNARAVGEILRQYLGGPMQVEARDFLAAYLCRTTSGFIPDPDSLDP